MVNERNCPENRLGDYLYWIDVDRFSLLRGKEPSLTTKREIRAYLKRQRIGRELFQYLDPVFRSFECLDEFFYPVSEEVHDERISASDKAEELMRRSIVAGLSEHVRSCKSCRTEYDNLIQRIARDKIELEQELPDLLPSYQDSFYQGMLTAEKKEIDLRLLGLGMYYD